MKLSWKKNLLTSLSARLSWSLLILSTSTTIQCLRSFTCPPKEQHQKPEEWSALTSQTKRNSKLIILKSSKNKMKSMKNQDHMLKRAKKPNREEKKIFLMRQKTAIIIQIKQGTKRKKSMMKSQWPKNRNKKKGCR